jgi:hypothetical protein
MNIVNRILATILMLLLLSVTAGTLALALGLIPASTLASLPHYEPLQHSLRDLTHIHPQRAKFITIAVATVVAGLSICLLVLELRPRRRQRHLILSRNRDGMVAIGFNTLRKVAEEVSMKQADVNRARCRVDSHGDSLRVRCNITADPFADASNVGLDVETSLKSRLEHTVGRSVEQIRVKVELAKSGDKVRVR